MNVLLKTTVALAVVGGLGAAQACSTAQWGTVSGATAKSVVNGSTRYEGLCALEAQQGQLVSNSISGSGDTYFRFYVFADTAQTGDVKIFSAKSGASEAAALTLGSGNTLKIGGQSTTLQAGKWTQVQLRVNGASADVWVDNVQKLSGVTVAGGNVDTISLGSLGGTQAGNIYFDAFVASNGEAVGEDGVSIGSDKQLISGDADGNGTVTLFDAVSILKEIQPPEEYAVGVPDCDVNGDTTLFDAVCVLKIIQ